jgi:hypothetical protein
VNLSQNFPSCDQLLNGGGWREHFADVYAISMGSLVNALDSGCAQQGQTAGVVGEFFTAEDRLYFRAACHDQILAASRFVRHWIFVGFVGISLAPSWRRAFRDIGTNTAIFSEMDAVAAIFGAGLRSGFVQREKDRAAPLCAWAFRPVVAAWAERCGAGNLKLQPTDSKRDD